MGSHVAVRWSALTVLILLCTAAGTSPLSAHPAPAAAATSATTVQTVYGTGGLPFNVVPQGTTQTDTPLGAATAAPPWVDPSTGEVVLGVAAAYTASAEADQYIGIDYLPHAPTGVSTTITVSTTVNFIQKDLDISVPPLAVACGPTSINYDDPNGQQTKNIDTCFEGTAGEVGISVVGAIITAVDEDADTVYHAILEGLTVINALKQVGTVQTATFTDTMTSTGGTGVTVEVDPQVEAADAGIWLAANMMDAVVTMTVSETYTPSTTVTMPDAEANLLIPTYQVPCQPSAHSPPCSYSLAPGSSLPNGLNLDGSHGGIYGAPATEGNYLFTVLVYDSQGAQIASYQYDLLVLPQLQLTTAALPPAEVGVPYSFFITYDGGDPPYMWYLQTNCTGLGGSVGVGGGPVESSIGGTSPPDYMTSLSGLPTTAEKCLVNYQVSDNLVALADANFTLSVVPRPTIATSQLPSGDAGVYYPQASLQVSGGNGPYDWANSTAVDGLSVEGQTGQVTGVPSNTGTYTLGALVSDELGGNGSAKLAFTVKPDPTVITTSLPAAELGQQYSATLAASGGQGHYAWTLSGAAPPGISLSTSGVLSGAPQRAGRFTLRVMASDGLAWASRNLALSVGYPQGPAVSGDASPSSVVEGCKLVCVVEPSNVTADYYVSGVATKGETVDFRASGPGAFNQTSCVTGPSGACGVSFTPAAPSGSATDTLTITAGGVSTTVEIYVKSLGQATQPTGGVIRSVQSPEGEFFLYLTGVNSSQVSDKVVWVPNQGEAGGALLFELEPGGVSAAINATAFKMTTNGAAQVIASGLLPTLYLDRSLGLNETYAEGSKVYNVLFSTDSSLNESVAILFAPTSGGIPPTTSSTTTSTGSTTSTSASSSRSTSGSTTSASSASSSGGGSSRSSSASSTGVQGGSSSTSGSSSSGAAAGAGPAGSLESDLAVLSASFSGLLPLVGLLLVALVLILAVAWRRERKKAQPRPP